MVNDIMEEGRGTQTRSIMKHRQGWEVQQVIEEQNVLQEIMAEVIFYYDLLGRMMRKPGECSGLLPDKVPPQDSFYSSSQYNLQIPRKKLLI